MYESYFGLAERPFSIAPDPQYLYMSARHQEAMAHLSYGLSQGGCFIVLTGEVGTGKTTLCRNLMTDLPDNVDVALILNANINETELLQTICDELDITYGEDNSQKQLLDLINAYLLTSFANNRHTVLIIDEAQLLSRDVLEQVRLLTNLETTKHKLLQIILIGQPELSDLLTRNDLRQLAQRVTARYHLGALSGDEIEEYVNYRLSVAGCKQPLFSKPALAKLHQLSDGIPRKINVLADHSLLATYSQSQRSVEAKTVKQAAREVFFNPESDANSTPVLKKGWLLACALLFLNLFLWWYFLGFQSDANQPKQASTANAQNSNSESISAQRAITEPAASALDAPQATIVGARDGATPDAISPVLESTEQEADSSNVSDQIGSARPSNMPVAQAGIPVVQDVTQSQQENESKTQTGSVVVAGEFLAADDQLGDRAAPKTVSGLAPIGAATNVIKDPSLEKTQFGGILETSADLTGRTSAFRELAQLWGADLPEVMLEPMCDTLRDGGLSCMTFSGGQKLPRLNRPAVLTLSHQGQLHRVVIERLDGDAAEIRISGTIYRISLDELQSRWQGEGSLIWRPPETGTRLLQLGDNNSAIPGVRALLNRALSQAELPILASVDKTQFDLDMSQKVFALQTSFGIVADSKIGNETYLLMNELVWPNSTLVLTRRTAR